MYVGGVQTVCLRAELFVSLYRTWLTSNLLETVSQYHNDSQQIDNYTNRAGIAWDIRYDEMEETKLKSDEDLEGHESRSKTKWYPICWKGALYARTEDDEQMNGYDPDSLVFIVFVVLVLNPVSTIHVSRCCHRAMFL